LIATIAQSLTLFVIWKVKVSDHDRIPRLKEGQHGGMATLPDAQLRVQLQTEGRGYCQDEDPLHGVPQPDADGAEKEAGA